MRAFIGISLNPEFKEKVIELMKDLKNKDVLGNYTLFNNLHMTVLFLGEITEEDEIEIINVLRKIKQEKFAIDFKYVGKLNNIVSYNGKSNQEIINIYNYLLKNLKNLDLNISKKDFLPHITLIRQNNDKLSLALENTLLVDNITLFSSVRIDGKLSYPVRYKVDLD